MALKLDPVRLLIADDVGIGKTVEACLVARELLDRGEALRLAVLCPPHLAEQWALELETKFHIDAEVVGTHSVKRLERPCAAGESLFDRHRHPTSLTPADTTTSCSWPSGWGSVAEAPYAVASRRRPAVGCCGSAGKGTLRTGCH